MSILILLMAFMGGVAAFFSPCSIPILPSYITYSASKIAGGGHLNALLFSILSSLGIVTIYLPLILIQSYLYTYISIFFPYISLILGLILIILSIVDLAGKFILPGVAGIYKVIEVLGGRDIGILSLYIFGVVYALSSLVCSAPIAFMVAAISINVGFIQYIATIIFFILGFTIPLFTVSLLIFSANIIIGNRLRMITRYLRIITPILLFIAGLYIILFNYMVII